MGFELKNYLGLFALIISLISISLIIHNQTVLTPELIGKTYCKGVIDGMNELLSNSVENQYVATGIFENDTCDIDLIYVESEIVDENKIKINYNPVKS